MADLVARMLATKVQEVMGDTPVALIVGARQTGKTTLLRTLLPDAQYVTLDEPSSQSAARNDPAGFLQAFAGRTVLIDEVQRAPDLLQAVKLSVDHDRRPGAFVLTGSANVLALPRISESLAGRMEVLELRPFAQRELAGIVREEPSFIDRVFATTFPRWRSRADRAENLARVLAGGYPESLRRAESRRHAWFRSYLATVLQREVTEISRVADIGRLSRLLGVLAMRSSQPLNRSRLASDLGIAWNTVEAYLSILKATFLIDEIIAWARSNNARITRQSKYLLGDSGLAAHLVGLRQSGLFEISSPLGQVIETFVGNELLRLRAATSIEYDLLFYRTQRGEEVDFVLERRGGEVVGIEVKSAATVDARDFRGIDALARDAGDDFFRGIILYTGATTVPFGRERYAVPLEALWAPPDDA